MDLAGLSALVVAGSSLLLGVLAWLSGRRKDRVAAVNAAITSETDRSSAIADAFQALVSSLQAERAALITERDALLKERDLWKKAADDMRLELATHDPKRRARD